MKKGTIILLNGPSSAGKTTLSRNVQKRFDEPVYYTSYDLTQEFMSPWTRYTEREVEDFLTVMYGMAKATSDLGRHIVVDNCFFDTERIYEIAEELLRDNPVLLVRVKCPLEELRRREIARGDRAVGKAEWQERHIAPKNDDAYDVIVDTFAESSEECADRIIAACRSVASAKE